MAEKLLFSDSFLYKVLCLLWLNYHLKFLIFVNIFHVKNNYEELFAKF